MSVEELVVTLKAADDKAEGAFYQAEMAKDFIDDSAQLLHGAVGGTVPGGLTEAVAALAAAKEQFEAGRNSMMVVHNTIFAYIAKISDGAGPDPDGWRLV
jgi:hypothetical protein